ncbi:hypothetical protein ACHAXR_008619 [Thalassiosira sp. AJA248-18]
MSPYPAIRRNGACTGSLWKSHSRFRGSSIPSFSSSISRGNGSATEPGRAPGLDSPGAVCSLDGILAEANERQRAHEFCVLVGNTLWSFSDVWAYAKGDPPTSEIRIVGASALNTPPSRNSNNARDKLASSPSPIATNSSPPSEAIISTPSLISPKSVDFLIVTYSGTHVRCSAPTPLDKDEWLAALHAGLEGNIMEYRVETMMVLSEQHKERTTKVSHQYQFIGSKRGIRNNCRGLRPHTKSDMMVQSAISCAMTACEAEVAFRPFVPPLPRVEVNGARTDRITRISMANSELDSLTSYVNVGCGSNTDATSCLPTTGYHSPCDDWSAPLSVTHCTACGRYPPVHAMRIDAAPLPEYGMEVRVDLCHDCWIAQGVLQHVRYLGWLYEVEASDRAAIRMAWDEVKVIIDRLEWENAGLESEDLNKYETNSYENVKVTSQSASHPLPLSRTLRAASAGALLELVVTEKFVAYRQRSNTLESLCQELEIRGVGCASDFLASIEECAQTAESSCLYTGEQETGNKIARAKEKICLRKEAFKVAGDMSAALKLLYEYALPSERRNLPLQSHICCSHLRDSADMLAAILEFFLDLCEEGQLDAVAFFWPQLCHIHMQMLPPRDAEEMVRVELMEDFLLTVSTRYSVHLALDLVWGLTADLEESLGSSNCNPLSRRRRFAILRFVSELESLLFDFEGGWGGGGVSLHGMLAPSQHQAALLRDAMSLLQLRRRFGSHYLTRSIRHDKLRAEALESLDFTSVTVDDTSVRAQIAKNAAYFSSHITFSCKLGDIAEKLRFMGLEHRPQTLREELKKINASAKILGGDPLNRICADGRFQRTVHTPINEGHVFRSKERTPVLLLAELVTDPSDTMTEDSESLKTWHFRELAGVNTIEEHDTFVLRDREQTTTKQSQCSDDHSLEAFCDQVESGNDYYPQSPPLPQQSLNISSSESPGRLSHRVLTLTPRASEATNATEMMVDLIATLIVNQKNQVLAPPYDDSDTDNSNTNHAEMRKSNQPTKLHRAALNDAIAQSLPGIYGSHPSLSPPASVVCVSPGIEREDARKISALGSVFPQLGQSELSSDMDKRSGIHLTADGQFRRDVLFAIMERGMRGSNVIAKGAATAARRAIQAMDRKRAIALINESATDSEEFRKDTSNDRSAECTPGFGEQNSSDITINASIDEGEVMEALRLLIIQNQVAQENLSSENAVKVGGTLSGSIETEADSDTTQKGVDAGEVDKRLAGCGQISSSVLSALRLWKGGIVSNGELLELVQKDLQFLKQSAVFGSADENKLIEDSAFWGRFSFGERWAEKKARLAASSPHGSLPRWDLIGCIVKSNDDLRQEAFVMQLIGLCEEAFRTAGLDLWVHPYEIVATGLSTGIIECVRNAMSFDSLKKRPGYGTDGLVGHFQRMTEIAADPFKALNEAKQNFVSSLAAYSLMSYLFLFKDRHNGNLLLDSAGHVIHIDFGFVFGIAPGGSFSLEQSTPFKLTDEMLEVMGGLGSPLFSEFVTLFCCGFLALQAHADTFLTVVEITCRGSNFHCFSGKDPDEIVLKLRERFCPELNKSQTVAYALDLIKFATTSYGTKQYDYFQYLSQGIAT